ncbi:MAG: hypothetical protein GF409_07290 [Candidatus Omnitrophica bacterium]|nr:hypothetical protein [Candidatus Omnitrophota bacterium]
MNRSGKRLINWCLVVAYMLGVYATLTVAPSLWDAVDGYLNGRGLFVVYLAGGFLLAAVFLYMSVFRREKRIVNYIILLGCACIYFILNKLAIYPAEKIHLLEYSLLSVLVFNALKVDFSGYGLELYVYGLLFCLGAGVIDEVIQLFLPTRVFDWRDVVFNIASSITAFVIIRFNILGQPQKALQA